MNFIDQLDPELRVMEKLATDRPMNLPQDDRGLPPD